MNQFALLEEILHDDKRSTKLVAQDLASVIGHNIADELSFILSFDRTTGLFDRRTLNESLDNLILDDKNFVFGILEINDFSLLTDLLGEEETNNYLKKLTNEIIDNTLPNQKTFRLSKYEFGIIFNSVDTFINLVTDIENYISNIENGLSYKNYYKPSINMGLSRYPEDALTAEELINNTRLAIKKTHNATDTKVFVYDPNQAMTQRELTLYSFSLKSGLENNEFYVVIQPKYDNNKNYFYGGEVLLRWNSKEFGFVSPAKFIAVAEENDMIIKLSKFVVNEAFKILRHINDNIDKDFYISINLSYKDLNSDEFYNYFVNKIEEYNVIKSNIYIEITERQIIQDISILEKYYNLGVIISVDDFGIKYTALNLLTYKYINEVKIDKTLIDDIVDNDRSKIIIRNTLNIAKDLNIAHVIEGVETKEQVDVLKESGASKFQGFYFSKPIDVNNLYDLLKTKC